MKLPPELELAARHFCKLVGRDPDAACKEAGLDQNGKCIRNLQSAAMQIMTHINCQRALMMASEELHHKATANGGGQNESSPDDDIDLDELPDPRIVLP